MHQPFQLPFPFSLSNITYYYIHTPSYPPTHHLPTHPPITYLPSYPLPTHNLPTHPSTHSPTYLRNMDSNNSSSSQK